MTKQLWDNLGQINNQGTPQELWHNSNTAEIASKTDVDTHNNTVNTLHILHTLTSDWNTSGPYLSVLSSKIENNVSRISWRNCHIHTQSVILYISTAEAT